MKISELIKQLERAKELHGDQEVGVETYEGSVSVSRIIKLDGKITIELDYES